MQRQPQIQRHFSSIARIESFGAWNSGCEDDMPPREPHQMRGAELRSLKQELEDRLRTCRDNRECEELRRWIDELEAESRRRSHIGRPSHPRGEREDVGGAGPADRANEGTAE